MHKNIHNSQYTHSHNNNNDHNNEKNISSNNVLKEQHDHNAEIASNNLYEYVNKECCCFNLRKITRAVTQYYDRYLEPSEIRSTQFTLLIELGATSAKTLTEIAENLVMDRTTLTRNLKPLTKMGLITIINTLDKRSKAYALTDKGKELINAGIPLWRSAQDNVINGLGIQNYEEIVIKLKKLLNIVHLNK